MERIMDYAVKRGIGEVWGAVLADNGRMLALCEELGFERTGAEDGIIHVRRLLRAGDETPQAAGRSSE
jgi:RimJ/RimL family protein N-acetyltransferase